MFGVSRHRESRVLHQESRNFSGATASISSKKICEGHGATSKNALRSGGPYFRGWFCFSENVFVRTFVGDHFAMVSGHESDANVRRRRGVCLRENHRLGSVSCTMESA